ncbi:transcription initiation factor TFIID subunit 15b-like [Jatropha curcas]|uniref:transcription initiation factor TFIID subunit 15b-like n=1 Tax=Jatropha curcas TaxID=180498 RepID=UPI0018938FA4|nr:transcription initiation factor TFIID subunit 15b-like [Jatropha curcas]
MSDFTALKAENGAAGAALASGGSCRPRGWAAGCRLGVGAAGAAQSVAGGTVPPMLRQQGAAGGGRQGCRPVGWMAGRAAGGRLAWRQGLPPKRWATGAAWLGGKVRPGGRQLAALWWGGGPAPTGRGVADLGARQLAAQFGGAAGAAQRGGSCLLGSGGRLPPGPSGPMPPEAAARPPYNGGGLIGPFTPKELREFRTSEKYSRGPVSAILAIFRTFLSTILADSLPVNVKNGFSVSRPYCLQSGI